MKLRDVPSNCLKIGMAAYHRYGNKCVITNINTETGQISIRYYGCAASQSLLKYRSIYSLHISPKRIFLRKVIC